MKYSEDKILIKNLREPKRFLCQETDERIPEQKLVKIL